MHAASVYPEPGSNSPKRCATLRPRLLSEGLTTRTSLSRISCHSSVVKVQRPRRDGPRRRLDMMGLGGPSVKPADRVVPGVPGPLRDLREGAARANGMGPPRVVSNAGRCPPGSRLHRITDVRLCQITAGLVLCENFGPRGPFLGAETTVVSRWHGYAVFAAPSLAQHEQGSYLARFAGRPS